MLMLASAGTSCHVYGESAKIWLTEVEVES